MATRAFPPTRDAGILLEGVIARSLIHLEQGVPGELKLDRHGWPVRLPAMVLAPATETAWTSPSRRPRRCPIAAAAGGTAGSPRRPRSRRRRRPQDAPPR